MAYIVVSTISLKKSNEISWCNSQGLSKKFILSSVLKKHFSTNVCKINQYILSVNFLLLQEHMTRFEASNVLHYSKLQTKIFLRFQLVCQKIKILHRIKFNQENFTKLLKRMHQFSTICCVVLITKQLTCFVKLGILSNRQRVHFQELLLKNITCFITSFLFSRVL